MLLAHSRNGVIRAATLESLGMPSSTAYRRCLPDGPWRRLLPGIVLLQNSPPNIDQHVTAALMYAGAGAMVTGLEACRRHGLKDELVRAPGGLHVLVPHQHKIRSAGFLTVERTRRLPRGVLRDQVSLAPLVRAVLDAVRRFTTFDAVAKLLVEAVQRGHCAPEGLSAELETGTKRGTAIPRRVLADITHVRSLAGFHARQVAANFRVPPTHWNHTLLDRHGRYLARPDAWWDDVGLGWEIDSVEFHFHGSDYARTLARNARYAEAGISVVQTLPSRLLHDAAAVRRELEAAYCAAASRPRPPVRLGSAA